MPTNPDPGAPGKPAKLRQFAEEDVDGFKSDTPRWVSFCPECGAKLPLAEHESCPNFSNPEKDASGAVTAFRCGCRTTKTP